MLEERSSLNSVIDSSSCYCVGCTNYNYLLAINCSLVGDFCFLQFDCSTGLAASIAIVVEASFTFSLSLILREVHLRNPCALVLELIPQVPRFPPPKLIPSSIIAIESPCSSYPCLSINYEMPNLPVTFKCINQ